MRTIRQIEDLTALLRELNVSDSFGIQRVGIFGSFARGEAFRDIDLYVEEDLDGKQALRFKQQLEAETGISFDIMLKKYAEPVVLYRAMKDMRYAATS
jgi:predicted nucleotidyltransferase